MQWGLISYIYMYPIFSVSNKLYYWLINVLSFNINKIHHFIIDIYRNICNKFLHFFIGVRFACPVSDNVPITSYIKLCFAPKCIFDDTLLSAVRRTVPLRWCWSIWWRSGFLLPWHQPTGLPPGTPTNIPSLPVSGTPATGNTGNNHTWPWMGNSSHIKH